MERFIQRYSEVAAKTTYWAAIAMLFVIFWICCIGFFGALAVGGYFLIQAAIGA